MRADTGDWGDALGYSSRVRLALLLCAAAALRAQSFQLTPSSAARGGAGSFLLKLASSERAAVALQWEFHFPPEITAQPGDLVAGSAAEASGKSLACALRETSGPQTYRCILAGSQKPIGDGSVAVVKYEVEKKAHPGEVTVRVESALGVSGAGEQIPIAPATGAVAIR